MNRGKMVRLFIFIIAILLAVASIYSFRESKLSSSTKDDNIVNIIPQYIYDSSNRESFEEFLNNSDNDNDYSPGKGSFEEYLNISMGNQISKNKIASEDIPAVKKLSFNVLSKNIIRIKECSILGKEKDLQKAIRQSKTNAEKLSDKIKIAKVGLTSDVAKEYVAKCENLVNRINAELSIIDSKTFDEMMTVSMTFEKEISEIIAEGKVIVRKK